MTAKRSEKSLRIVGAPQQARSEDTLRRLLDAAAAVLAERGHQDLSIAEIARRAGSSVGGFYARFRSKDDVLRALEADHFRRLSALLDEVATPERWRDATAEEIVRGLLGILVETHRRSEPLILAFVARAVRDPSDHPELVAFRQRLIDRLVALAAARRDLIRHPDPALAARFAIEAVLGVLQARVMRGAAGLPKEQLPDDVVSGELERLVLSYLGLRKDIP